ncbi:MAG TPA: GNAT family N-acetyltransferase [Thermoplasmata archaeon]|nr:GNAT family N-acetyltransferase [Thermoplasmata archaeon]
MLELDPREYSGVAPLVEKVPFNTLFAQAVLDGKVSGRILVDDATQPATCLVVHKYGMTLLSGRSSSGSFNAELRSFLKNDSLNHGTARWLICYPDDWKETLRALLGADLVQPQRVAEEDSEPDRWTSRVVRTERVNFRFDAKSFAGRRDLPSGFSLKRIDSEVYDQIQGSVIPQLFWDSPGDFLRSGVGFSLLMGKRVVSTCFSSFIIGRQLELGAETRREYRNRGLSIFPATAMVDHCLANGYEPVWACRKENLPSFKLAEKLGFSPSTTHPYYSLPTRKATVPG